MSTAKTTGTEAYQKPKMELVEMELEGYILAGSGGSGENFGSGGGWSNQPQP